MLPDASSRRQNRLILGLSLALTTLVGLVCWQRLRAAGQMPRFLNIAIPGTALITGASSGIGAAFARRLAGAGYDLVLVARREERLAALAAELQQQYGIKVEVLVADLARMVDIERVARRVGEIETLRLLINNAGFGTSNYFSESELSTEMAMIDVHLKATLCLSRAAIPGMLARRQGAIINVSSAAAFFPTPGAATYGASKSYLNVFSEALHGELWGTGVKVQALCPGFTRTGFHYTPEYKDVDWTQVPGILWLKAGQVVAESLRALDRNQVICIPSLRYKLAVRVFGNPAIFALIRPIYLRVRGRLGLQM
jgi:hypothetical protein